MEERAYRIEIPDTGEEEALDDSLMAFNLRQVPPTQEDPFWKICRCAKDGAGRVIGGVLACAVLWHILHIETVWVEAACRREGIATALMAAVEEEARARGCYLACLNTYDFQAKPFYEKLGYQVCGQLADAPKGHTQYFLYKKL